MTARILPDPHQIAAADPDQSVFVTANAGSGKTSTLVDRVARLLLKQVQPGEILCVTYTKAAAAEMQARLFERLGDWAVMDDAALAQSLADLGGHDHGTSRPEALSRARRLFAKALDTPGGLKIQTIHAFCERVLQLFPVEAGIVPHFTMLDDRESLDLLQEARNAVLSAAKDETTDIGRALNDVVNRVNADDFDKLLTQLLAKRSNLRMLFEEESGLERVASS